ncbi:phage tail protein [Pendulispora albinea]|uniref:Phage tail protein n=1 Tax=Pendulispora albinea TaxID=2741071 RepID=A0ABZ2MAQ2_9BACT
MSQATSERLYALLPSVYRRRDAQGGEALRALLAVMEEQLDAVSGDIRQLYDNWFIETCDEWVVPYIGDALGVQLAHPFAGEGLTLRAYIANTLGLRRRKGTAGTLERVAQDVSGWPAKAVEYFQLLATTQPMGHVRASALGTATIRDSVALELVGGPFERGPYSVDVRSIARGQGRYNISNVGVFLWTLRSAKAEQVMATVARDASSPPGSAPGFFRVNPLGADQALWNPRDTSARLDVRQSEDQVPGPLRRVPLARRLDALRALGQVDPNAASLDASALNRLFRFTLNDTAVRPEQIAICNLTTWHRPSAGSPPNGTLLAIDPASGRIALPEAAPPASRLLVTYFHGAPAEIGGGSYARIAGDEGLSSAVVQPIPPAPRAPSAVDVPLTELATALQTYTNGAALSPPTTPVQQILELGDSFTYALRDVKVPAGAHLQIRASRVGPERPLLVATAAGSSAPIWNVTLGPGARLTLEGLWIAAQLRVTAEDGSQLAIAHTTLVPGVTLLPDGGPGFPGTPSVELLGDGEVGVVVRRAIAGPILGSATAGSLAIEDSVIDAGDSAASPPGAGLALRIAQLAMKETTVLGGAAAGAVTTVEDSIFTAPLIVQRTQQGCVRFSFLPKGSITPRPFRCQPQLALAELGSPADPGAAAVLARVLPVLSSTRYGAPDYARLGAACPLEIAGGGSDGSEMGAYRFLQIPKRNSNLQAALAEYLRFGLEVGTFSAFPLIR